MGEIKLDGFLCDRCDHIWASRKNSEQKPTVCPRCKSPYWNIPRKDQSYEKKLGEIFPAESLFPPRKKSDERLSLFPQKNKDG